MTNKQIFTSYIPEDEASLLPVLTLLKEKGFDIIPHPDITAFDTTPDFIYESIESSSSFLMFVSDKYTTFNSYTSELSIAKNLHKHIVAVVIERSFPAMAFTRTLNHPIETYFYYRNPLPTQLADILEKSIKTQGGYDPMRPISNFSVTANANRIFLRGLALYKLENYNAAHSLFFNAAESGHTKALFYLGLCSYLGHGTPQDYAEAFDCFQDAALKNDCDAQYYLAVCFLEGFGVKKDNSEAVFWLKKAAAQNQESALILLNSIKNE